MAESITKEFSILDGFTLFKQGAEARIYTGTFCGKKAILKERFKKAYRHPELDESLSKERIRAEVKGITRCRTNGVRTPTVYLVDLTHRIVIMEYIEAQTSKEYIDLCRTADDEANVSLNLLLKQIGSSIAQMHQNNVIHGDLTTSNMLVTPEEHKLIFIDFGLSYIDAKAEDKGVDLYVLERAFLSTHPNSENMFKILLESYAASYGKGAKDILKKLDEVRMRGRKRTMVG